MKYILILTLLFTLPLFADVKTASGKELKTENLGVSNIRVW